MSIRVLVLLALAAWTLGAQGSVTATYTYSGQYLPIAYSTSDFTVAEITVPRALNISSVTVQMVVDYPAVGDLNVFLYSAYGTRTILLEKNCGSLQNIDTTFADSAPTKFSSFCPTEAGRGPFQGNQPLANSNGQSSLGVWRLAIQNNKTPGNSGLLREFAVTITGVPLTRPAISPDTIVSAASLKTGSLAPGQRILIFGSGLGPAEPATAPDGQNWPQVLGGSTVFIDGIAAAIHYASARELEVQVPYAEIPGTYARITVSYGGQNSETVQIYVRTARPAVYTTGVSGKHLKAVDAQGNLNSSDNPAPKGSYLTFYAVGLGDTVPRIPPGVITPLPPPLLQTFYGILVYIGGVQAPVSFAGLAPGLVGVYQVNIQVPDNAPSGAQDFGVVAVNGAVSQDGVVVDIQ